MKNSAIVKDFVEEVFNRKTQNSIIFKSFSENVLFKSFFGKRTGLSSFQLSCVDWIAAFPDIHFHFKKLEQYGNTVIAQYQVKGTHLSRYLTTKVTNPLAIQHISPLLLQIEKVAPTYRCVDYLLEATFVFRKKKIIIVTLQEPIQPILFKQLGFFVRKEAYPNQSITIDDEYGTIATIREITKKQLTTREIQCLSLNLLGFSAKQIARILDISFRTAKSHLHKAVHTFGCFNKLQCLETIQENNLLPIWRDLAEIILKKKNPKNFSLHL